MAAHSNRCRSPISSRPINPKLRNSEQISSTRRSFSGTSPSAKPSFLTNPRRLNPTTPANSPSDFSARRSVGKEGTASLMGDFKDKENDEKESVLNVSKLLSPAKGCKSFMAPTISAASKFTPSPRKKVLVERNEPVRTSISLSDGKAMLFSLMPFASQDLEPKSELVYHQTRTTKTCLDSHIAVPKPCKKVKFSQISSDSQHSTESAVTHSDGVKLESSSIAPLDADPSLPLNDPEINYSPNLRLLNKEEWLDPDDSLMAEIMCGSFSDKGSDETEEKETETSAASADMVIGVDEEIEVQNDSRSAAPADEEGVVQNNGKKKRWLCFSMILTLLFTSCVLITVKSPPSFDEMFVKDLSFSDISNLYQQSRDAVASARSSFRYVVNRVSANSVAMLFKLANELGEGEKRATFQFMNLSDLQDDTWNTASFPSVISSLEQVENLPADEFEEEMDTEMDYEFEVNEYADVEDVDTFEEEAESYAEVDIDEETLAAEEISTGSVNLAEFESQDFQIEKEMNILSADHQQAATSKNQETELELDQTSFGLVIAPLFASLLAVTAALIYYKRNQPRVEEVLTKQTPQQEKETSLSWRTESEMSSSYQNSASYSMMREGNEVESSERKPRRYLRRESLASSSGSPSYGSFTTYERIPTKSNGTGDEEIMTPVRRSNRIRNHHQITSP